MAHLLRISQELIPTQPIPAVESRGAVAAVALPALTEAESPHPLLDQYDIVFITPETSWEEIDLFLLGETHYNEQCYTLNGAFIRAFGGDEVTVFRESVPSMQELSADEQEESREELGLSSRARFIGWDAGEEVLEILRAGEGSTEQNLAATQRTMQEIVQRRDKYRAQEREFASLQDDDSGEINSLCEKDYALFARAYKDEEKFLKIEEKLLVLLHEKEQVLKRLIERKIMHIVDPSRSTFPTPTRSMVETLQQVRKIDSKVFLIAGQGHLRSIPLCCSGPEFDLGPMHRELAHHKAAILVPKICRRYEDIVVDNPVLPEGLVLSEGHSMKMMEIAQAIVDSLIPPKGLVLTEEQKEDLKERLISQPTTTQEILDAFFAPMILPDLGKMEIAQAIDDELELPEGLVLTEKQSKI
jgi:hypothetical protein